MPSNKLKMMKTKYMLLLTLSFSLLACSDDEQEDKVHELNKDGAVESEIVVEHLNDSLDVVLTKHKVWKEGKNIKSIVYKDTVSALGYTNVEAENSEGETQLATVKKDYEVFITVK